MIRNHKKFDFRTAYIDLLINLLTGTVVLFILTTLLIAPITAKNEGIKKNADYIITMEWPVNIDCDLDIWVRDPMNNTVSYKMKDAALMYIERDDMGNRRSVFNINGKDQVIDPDNKEYVTLRGTFTGEYVVNVHVYSCGRGKDSDKGLDIGTNIMVPVTVEIMKVNPDLITIKHIEMIMRKVGEEQTAFRFVMNDNKFVNRFYFDFISIVTGNKDER